MKTVDLTIFNDIKEEDFHRVALREWVMNGKVDLTVKIRKDQEEDLLKLQWPRWRDGRTKDGKLWKQYKTLKRRKFIKVYETDYAAIKLEVV